MMMMMTMTMLMIEKTLQCTANGRESNQLQREKAEANYPNRDCSDCALWSRLWLKGRYVVLLILPKRLRRMGVFCLFSGDHRLVLKLFSLRTILFSPTKSTIRPYHQTWVLASLPPLLAPYITTRSLGPRLWGPQGIPTSWGPGRGNCAECHKPVLTFG